MNATIVFCEEPSCAEIVRSLCDRLDISPFVTVLHYQGKTDLKRSFPRRIGAWADQGARFIVLHDQDGRDCTALKTELLDLVPATRRDASRIRIVCRELEAWYLSDLEALVQSGLISESMRGAIRNKAIYRDPDGIADPKQLFFKLHDERGAILIARRVGPFLRPERSRSRSFRLFAQTLTSLAFRQPHRCHD